MAKKRARKKCTGAAEIAPEGKEDENNRGGAEEGSRNARGEIIVTEEEVGEGDDVELEGAVGDGVVRIAFAGEQLPGRHDVVDLVVAHDALAKHAQSG